MYVNSPSQLNSGTEVKLHTANAIFFNPNIVVKPMFVEAVNEQYFATSSNFDLNFDRVGGPEKAINDLVNATTEGLIQDVLPEGILHVRSLFYHNLLTLFNQRLLVFFLHCFATYY